MVAATLTIGVVRDGGGGRAIAGSACPAETVRLRIGADPTVTPWLHALVDSYTSLHRKVADRCVEPEVATVTPADVVAGRTGVDVWVPESSGTVGLARTRPGGAELLAVPTPSIASSRSCSGCRGTPSSCWPGGSRRTGRRS